MDNKIDLQELGKCRRKSNEGGTSVKDDSGVLKLGNVLAKGNGVKVYLPVGLSAERDLDQLSGVVALVNTTKGSLRGITFFVAVAEVEGKDRLIKRLLVQHVIERRDNLVDGDGVESKTQDTVKAAKGESQARLVGGFGEVLVLDGNVADRHSVAGNKALKAA